MAQDVMTPAQTRAAAAAAAKAARDAATKAPASTEPQLEFLGTQSIEAFKADNPGCGKLRIIRNPNPPHGLFFEAEGDSTLRGAVSEAYAEDPCISRVMGADGTEFWLIHKRGSDSDNVVDSL